MMSSNNNDSNEFACSFPISSFICRLQVISCKHLLINDIILSQNKTELSKLLVLVDGSLPSINAADCAISLAKKERGDNLQELIALHVVFSRLGYAYSPSGTFGSSGLTAPDTIRELLENTKKEAEAWFDKIRQKINNKTMAVKISCFKLK